MKLLVITLSIIIIILIILLLRYEYQMRKIAEILEKTPVWSNQRLYSGLQTKTCIRLCNAINKRLEEAKQNQISAEEAQKELKYLMASISHDIRTPLTSSIGYLQLIRSDIKHYKKQQYLEIIEKKLFDLSGMLDNLFFYSKLTNNTVVFQLDKIDICQVICEILLEFELQLNNLGIIPEMDFAQKSYFVIAEKESTKRVCRNLIENALLYGKGDLKVIQKSNEVSFSNRIDESVAIDTSMIFKRFYRSDVARNSTHSGLGLAIVEQLVTQMGGTIEAKVLNNYLTITICWKKENGSEKID
ncbi:HAMP domain-containing histidine kinase [Clostridioides difficile]|nr:HAMP domain-containing histidine kinase [Clostridioides difficile]